MQHNPLTLRQLFILVLGVALITSIVSAADPALHPNLSNTKNPVLSAAAINPPDSPLSGQLMFSYGNSTPAGTLQTASAGWRARLSSARIATPDSKKALLSTGGTKETRTGGNSTDPFAVIDEKLAPSEAAGLKSLIHNTLHAFSYNEATGDWYARNAANRITFTYTRDGTAKFSGGENAFGLTLLGIGRGDGLSPAGKGHVQAEGRQLNITRPEYTEWYRNNDAGVEQGITIGSRPAGSGLLHVEFGLTGNNSLSLKDTKTLILIDASGTPSFEYTGLHAFSSDGRDLPASLATDGTTLSWVVDDTGAVYPVTIDPVVVSASKATATFTGGAGGDIGSFTGGDYFGTSVALNSSGTMALVGAVGNSTAASNAGAAYIFTMPAGGWSSKSASAATATFTGIGDSDNFGNSVALNSSGAVALIGASQPNTATGAAYIFTMPTGGWSGTTSASAATATFTGIGNRDNFGNSVALNSSGAVALIGAYLNDTTSDKEEGAAYIFTMPTGGWSGTTSASAANATFNGGATQDNFGNSVALNSSGTMALIGAPNNKTAVIMGGEGAAYIFTMPTGGWSGTTSASAANAQFIGGARDEALGWSVALSSDGTRALIGAHVNDTAGSDAGAAYIFEAPGGVWGGTTSASAANATFTGGASGDYFGYSVALSSDGTRALVGACYNDTAGTDAGAAYTFTMPAGGWSGTNSASTANATFTGAGGYQGQDDPYGDYLGWSVALNSSGGVALVGATYNQTAGYRAGAAYIFQPPYVPLTATGITTGAAGTAVVDGLKLNPTTTLTNVDLYLGTSNTTITGTKIKTGVASLPASVATTVDGVSLVGKTAGTYYIIACESGTTSILGATTSAVYTVTVSAPVASFSSTNTSVATNSTSQGWSGVAPFTMVFNDTSTNSPTSWKWGRNNLTVAIWEQFSTTNNATQVFVAGNWSVNLTATNSAGSGISGITWVNVSTSPASPVAGFTGTPLSGTAPLAVTFTDTSTGTPTSWNWVFGDGNTSTIQSPVFTYVTSGYFTVKLTAANAFGSSAKTISQYIAVAAVSRQNSTENKNITQTISSGQTNVNVSTCDPGMTVTNTTTQVLVTNPALGWQKYTFEGANITKNTCYVNISVSNVTMDSTPFTAPLPGLGTVSTSLTIGQNQTTSGTLQQEIIPGANTTVTNAFQLAATNIGLTLGNIAYTLQIGGAAPFNRNLTSSGVIINMSASHSWVLANGGTGAIRIFRYSDTGAVQVLPTTFVGTDAGSIDYFRATSVNGFSEFGLGGTSTTPGPSGGGGGGGDSDGPVSMVTPQQVPGTTKVNVGGDSAVTQVAITGTGISGAIVTGTVVSGPGLNTDPPTRMVYEYVDITPARYTTISEAVISFTVPVTWLTERQLTPPNVVMYHLVGQTWVALPTTLVKVENGVAYYTAASPGFSRFAITGQAGVTSGTPLAALTPAGQTFGDLSPTTSVTKTPTPAAVTVRPVTTQTTVIPAASQPAPALPLPTMAIVGGVVVVLVAGGFLIRRWWIRRQNPALFRDYD